MTCVSQTPVLQQEFVDSLFGLFATPFELFRVGVANGIYALTILYVDSLLGTCSLSAL